MLEDVVLACRMAVVAPGLLWLAGFLILLLLLVSLNTEYGPICAKFDTLGLLNAFASFQHLYKSDDEKKQPWPDPTAAQIS